MNAMQTPESDAPVPVQFLSVFCADDFTVTDGANLGDAIADASELVHDDVYGLAENARQVRMAVSPIENGPLLIAADSKAGTAGHHLHLDCTLTLMSSSGETLEAVVLVEVDPSDGALENIYLLPLAPLLAKTDYRLVGFERDTAKSRLAEVACVSFSRGTHITLSDGHQCKIEELRVGDRVLTRDEGVQTVRWIGQNTMRAIGDFAPIVIKKGTLNNENDLIVSPNHRLFIYQREDTVGIGRAEILVKAKHLLNGDTVYRRDGGFVDYFQLLFDHHQIIYAEGIAAESLLLDQRTTPALPEELPTSVAQHAEAPHRNFEVEKDLLSPDAAERLRRASDQ